MALWSTVKAVSQLSVAFYGTADVDVPGGKHYLATTFVVSLQDNTVDPDDQNTELHEFSTPFPELHTYVDRYLDAIHLLDREPAVPEERSYR